MKNFQTKQSIIDKIYKEGYLMAQYTIEKNGLRSFDPENSFRRFISEKLERETYDPVMSVYLNFFNGQKDALEDFNFNSEYANTFNRQNPLILDLNEIMRTLSLHNYIGNKSINYNRLSDILKSFINYGLVGVPRYTAHKYYFDFLLQILEKLKFISRAGDDYLITPIGSEYIKNYDKDSFLKFLKNFEPTYPLRKETSELIKNPRKSKLRK